MTRWAHSQFPSPDLHRLDTRPHGLRAEERCEKLGQEGVLQLEHVGVEVAVAGSMSLDVEKEPPPLPGPHRLRPTDECEQRLRGFLEPLVRVDDVLN